MYNRKQFKQEAKQLIKASAPHFMLVTLVYWLLTSGVSYVVSLLADFGGLLGGAVSFFLNILVFLFSMVMSVGFSNYALRLSRKEETGMDSLFTPFSYAGRSIGMTLLVAVYVVLWSLLASVVFGILFAALMFLMDVVPALAIILMVILYIALLVAIVVISLRYSMASFALAEDPDAGVMAAIRRSVQMLRGHKGKLFVMMLSFIGWELLVALIGSVVMSIGFLVMGVEWYLQVIETAGQDPFAAYNLTSYMIDRMFIWVVLGEVLALPLTLWLMPYQQTAYARFFNHVSGYDYHKYMEGEQNSASDAPFEVDAQPIQPPAGGYYTAPNPPEEPTSVTGGTECADVVEEPEVPVAQSEQAPAGETAEEAVEEVAAEETETPEEGENEEI